MNTINLTPDEAGFLESFEVLGNCGLGEWKDIGEVSAETAVLSGKCLQDCDARRVCQCFGNLRGAFDGGVGKVDGKIHGKIEYLLS